MHHVIDHRDLADVRVHTYNDRESAVAACPSEGGASVVSSVKELAALSPETLVAVFNRLRRHAAEAKNVKGIAMGSKDLWAMLETPRDPADGRIIEEAPAAPPADAPTKEDTVAKSKSKPKKANGNGAKRGAAGRGDKKIHILSKENPKRKGTEAHKLFALYKNGMSVAEALAKGVPSGYISWDVKHKYIELRA